MSATSPVLVVLDQDVASALHRDGENAWWLYCTEVLDHVRLAYDVVTRDGAREELRSRNAVVVHARDGRIVTRRGETPFAADVWQQVVRIQQGRPVSADGTPAADGSARSTTASSSADDGLALSYEPTARWHRRRAGSSRAVRARDADGARCADVPPAARRPVAEAFAAVLFWTAEGAGQPVGWLSTGRRASPRSRTCPTTATGTPSESAARLCRSSPRPTSA